MQNFVISVVKVNRGGIDRSMNGSKKVAEVTPIYEWRERERERATWDVIVRVYRNPINGGGGKQKGGTHDPPVIPTFTGSFSTEKN